MATQYIHDFPNLASANASAPQGIPNAVPFYSINGVLQVTTSQPNLTKVSGELIGFQSKPRAGAAGSQAVFGAQIGPSVNNGIAITREIVGLHAEVYLRGTSAGALGSDVRALNLELVTDDGGTRDITGAVSAIRIRAAFSANTVSGVVAPFRVETMETQTNSESWDCLFELPTNSTGAWNNDPTTENDGALQGYIKVIINGVDKYIRLYAVGATAD
jgi:hypothetical protein